MALHLASDRTFTDRGGAYRTSLTDHSVNPIHKAIARAAPQSALVLEYLSTGRGLSGLIAHTVLGVTSLTTRVAELRKLGLPIVGTWQTDHAHKRFMVYKYVPSETSYDEEEEHVRWEDEGGPPHPLEADGLNHQAP